MRAKHAERQRAIEMAHFGCSVRRIAAELGVAQSSVSVWTRDVRRTHIRLRMVRLPVLSGRFRRCGKCDRRLPVEFFSRHPQTTYQYWCKECFRAYFRHRGDMHRREAAAAKRRRQDTARRYVRAVLERSACADCGVRTPAVLDFDHVRGTKTRPVSYLVAAGRAKSLIADEIAKCEVVCANCHRRRTGYREGSWRATISLGLDEPLPAMRPRVLRNWSVVRSVMEAGACVDCGNDDIMVLEFDHVARKTAPISRAIRNEYSLARLSRELDACELRCANCHRLRTAERRGGFRHHHDAPVAQLLRAIGF
jgi:hypothetical protein